MISIKQLTYALAIAKALHFRKAAQACAISQSTLSSSLTELEKHLGFQIFERSNKNVFITPLGQLFIEKAQLIKLQLDDLAQLAQQQSAPLTSSIKLGVIPTIAPYLLPKVLPQLRSQYPNLPMSIIEEQSHVLVDMVQNGELDTAILALPYPLAGLLSFEFWQEDFYWVTHHDDADGQSVEINSGELVDKQLILLKDGHCLKDHVLSVCKFGNNQANSTLNSTSLHTIVQMVAGKMGTTLLPQMALGQLLNNNTELSAVHLNETSPHRRIAFITRAGYVGVNDIQQLMTLFRHSLLNEQS